MTKPAAFAAALAPRVATEATIADLRNRLRRVEAIAADLRKQLGEAEDQLAEEEPT